MSRNEPLMTMTEVIEAEDVCEIVADAHSYALAGTTEQQYGYRFRVFESYCDLVGKQALPASPDTVLGFLAVQSRRTAPRCVKLFKSAIRSRHVMADLPDPTATAVIDKFISGISRKYGMAVIKKKALRTDEIRSICINYDRDGGLVAMRGKAALMTGFFGCLRASELVHIRIDHIEFCPEGLTIRIPKSKTDQEGAGQIVAIPRGAKPETDPVLAVEEWLEALAERLEVDKVETGPLLPALRRLASEAQRVFPVPITMTRYRLIIKQAVEGIGLDPAAYSGHSCRSGHATSAARAGASRDDIKRQGRWQSDDVVSGYIQEGTKFKDNSCNSLGL